MSKPLYRDAPNFSYNEFGIKMVNEFSDAIKPLIEKWMEEGYSPRDIGGLVCGLVPALVSEIIVVNRIKQRKLNEK